MKMDRWQFHWQRQCKIVEAKGSEFMSTQDIEFSSAGAEREMLWEMKHN